MLNILWDIMEFYLGKNTDLVHIWKKMMNAFLTRYLQDKTLQAIGGLGKFNELTGHMYNEKQYKA